ncbi:hypothetical protein M5D96_001904, partial [Drosophila gunungcola]
RQQCKRRGNKLSECHKICFFNAVSNNGYQFWRNFCQLNCQYSQKLMVLYTPFYKVTSESSKGNQAKRMRND